MNARAVSQTDREFSARLRNLGFVRSGSKLGSIPSQP